jgi:uncharacterized membrane protein YhaH (DUF805 family)
MVISVAVFTCGLSLLLQGESHPDRPAAPSWVLASWCLAFLGGVTLLSAKRLLDCRRPLWLALFIPLPSLPLFAFASGMITSPSLLAVLVVYLLPFAMPAFIACAFYEWDD